MRGLNPNYGAYVEPKQPKYLVEDLKYAHIYTDITHRSKLVFGKGKDKETFNLKRKFFKNDKERGGASESFRRQGGRWKKKLRPRKPKNKSK